jgi:hypothetical protein
MLLLFTLVFELLGHLLLDLNCKSSAQLPLV